MLSPTGKANEEIEFEVESGESFNTIIEDLKEEDLIKSEFFFKIFLKIKNPSNLDAGIYKLNKGMNAGDLVNTLSKRNTFNKDAINITIPEGKHISDIAEILGESTNTTKEMYLDAWKNSEFLDTLINKYWFITDEIKNDKIRYPLEGYFFPSTYELLNKDVTPEYVAYKLLDQMEVVLNKYKEKIEESNYTVHELLTLASMVEYEAVLDEDRALISGVFYNRLNNDMKLESCATVGYAIDEWKLSYTNADLKVDSPYNTYVYGGLPVGPANMPSEKSIIAAINPEGSEYYYFLGDVCSEDGKTYYSKTLSEHEEKVSQYLTCY